MDTSEAAKTLGKKGGDETKKRGADYYREIQKKSVEARKANKEKKEDKEV